MDRRPPRDQRGLADHPSVGIIVHHEPEGGEDRLDGATFEATFGRARDEIKAGWSGARVAYCAMAYQWRPGGLAAKHPDHWRRVVADEYLCDVYSGMNERNGAFPTELILPEHPGYVGWFKEIVRPHLAWNSIGREKERARLLHHDSPAAMRELTTDFAERVQ